MDPVMERVRAADPVSVDEFAGLADFDALELDAAPPLQAPLAVAARGGRRGRRAGRVPSGAPAASEVVQRAIQTMAVPSDQILYAKSHASDTGNDYGERQVWVYGDKQMRWLEADNEEVYAEGKGTTRWLDGKVENHPDVRMVPNEIFRAGALLRRPSRPRASR